MAQLLSQRYKRYVGHDGRIQRETVLNPLVLITSLFIVLMSLALVYPKESLTQRLFQANIQDALTLAYVENLIRFEPNNMALRLLYLKEKLPGSTWNQLIELAQPILLHGDLGHKKEVIMLLLTKLETLSEPQVTKQAEMLLLLRLALSFTWQISDYEKLIQLSLSAHNIDLTQQLLVRWLQQQPDNPVELLESVAKYALAQGHYQLSAQLFFDLRYMSDDVEYQAYALIQGISILLAGNMQKQAMMAAKEHSGELIQNLTVLRYLIYAAQAAGDTKVASEYARLLVGLSRE